MRKKPVAVTLFRPKSTQVRVLKRFDKVQEAEDFIGQKTVTDPDGVYRGDYGIDAPESMINGNEQLVSKL